MGFRSLLGEWLARRDGRRQLPSHLSRSAREIVGPTGAMFSNGWDAMADGSSAYVKSFDRRLPPSIFVSERDRQRNGMPIPIAERCLEDWSNEGPATPASDAAPLE